MNIRLSAKFAIKNIIANKLLMIPFLLSNGIMGILFYIMYSLQSMDFVKYRHQSILFFIQFGIVLIMIFTTVFMFYSNRIIMKNRNKEFSLYGILGLEKKHIAKILFMENAMLYLIIASISSIGGILFGKFTLLGLNILLKNYQSSLVDYQFSTGHIIATFLYFLVVFTLTYLINLIKISISTPMELLSKQKKGESEPKVNWIYLILGIGCLSTGYYMALTTNAALKAIGNFFIAALFVIAGTYYLFISLSIILLKALKKNKNIFYKDINFITISGMLYRMRANAVGLASITILSASIIVTLSSTSSVYSQMEDMLDTHIPTEYSYSMPKFELNENSQELIEEKKKELHSIIESTLEDSESIKNLTIKEEMFSYLFIEGNEIKNSISEKNSNDGSFFIFQLLDTYNQNNKKDYTLKENEMFVFTNAGLLKDVSELVFAGEKFKIKEMEEKPALASSVEAHLVLVKDLKTLEKFAAYYQEYNPKTQKSHNARILITANWNMEHALTNYAKRAKIIFEQMPGSFETRADAAKDLAELNGGFLFLGMIVGLVFLTGNILITYYKQISEGYDDREKYQIMKKVGLPNSLIAKSTRRQILWIFFLPLVVSVIHCLVASKILFKLLMLFGIFDFTYFIKHFMLTILVFAILYFIVFLITSKMYYKIVTKSNLES